MDGNTNHLTIKYKLCIIFFMIIYRILNIFTGDFYIGSTRNFSRRKSDHLHRLRRGKSTNSILQKAWNKYGKEAFIFETIEEFEIGDLIEREQYYIDNLNPKYNVRIAADLNIKPITQFDLNGLKIKDWGSMSEASESLDIGLSSLSSCCHNKNKSTHGFIFQFTFPNRVKKYTLDKIKRRYGEQNSNNKLTLSQVQEIRSLAHNFSQRELGEKYGVSHKTIGKILHNKTWKMS